MDVTLIGVATGSIALGAAAVKLAQTILSKDKGDGDNSKRKSGDVDPAVWRADITRIIREENEDLMGDIRMLLEARAGSYVKEIKDPILTDLKETRHDIRSAMQEAIGRAYQMGKDSK